MGASKIQSLFSLDPVFKDKVGERVKLETLMAVDFICKGDVGCGKACVEHGCQTILVIIVNGMLRHFPDSDPTYKDISSLKLLQMVKERATSQGFSVSNVDATVIVEKPKLRSYITKMIHNISHILEIDPTMVNIKASTNEGMGFVGRNEGIAVFSVVSLEEGMKRQ